jgi:hypothetical protein
MVNLLPEKSNPDTPVIFCEIIATKNVSFKIFSNIILNPS